MKEEAKALIQKIIEGKASIEEMARYKKMEDFFIEKNKSKVFKNDLDKNEVKKSIYKNIKKKINHKTFYWLKVAASILIVVGLGYQGMNMFLNKSTQIVISNTLSTPKKIVMPDGSIIQLNSNSKISYYTSFNKKMRNVVLNGEAFFKVAKNTSKPFIIKTGNLETRVVGTQFNIKESTDKVQVTVTEGKVKVYHGKDTLNLAMNDQAIFNTKTNSLTERQVNSNLYDVWLKETITLKRVKLKELACLIEKIYQTKVVFIDSEAKVATLSLTFKKTEPLENLINMINLISEVKLTKNLENETIEIRNTK